MMSVEATVADSTTVTGILSRIVYHQANFAIIQLETPDGRMSAKGEMLSPQLGLEYTLSGEIETHPRWGDQLAFRSYSVAFPTDEQAIRYYLQENCRWIGVQVSRKLVGEFGAETLKTCKESPELVAERISGITLDRALEIAATLRHNEKSERVQLELKTIFGGTKITRTAISRMLAKWEEKTVEVVRADPYRLVEEIEGVGFLSADDVARGKLDVKMTDTKRVSAGVIHVLREAAFGRGHTCLPAEDLAHEAVKLLGISEELVRQTVDGLVQDKKLSQRGNRVYLPGLLKDELLIAEKLKMLARQKLDAGEPATDGLFEDQIAALAAAIEASVFILTGAPGTGKTHTLKRVIESFPEASVALAAPTGKAAKRMFEQSGTPARTIHKLLEPLPVDGHFEFQRNRENPIGADLIILDETSMIDVQLAARFLDAVAPGTRLVFVGDTYQLPAVGPGNVLRDMLASGEVPAVELTTIKRQDPGLIVTNCHRVKAGQDIAVQNGKAKDFFFLAREGEDEIRQAVVDMVVRRLPKAGFDPLADVQVISPRREKLKLSCGELNRILQAELNKSPAVEGVPFRVGDKVIQTKNDYENDIINGDIGIVLEIVAEGKQKHITVRFSAPERTVELPLRGNNLELAYALTVHKMQGSEAPVVIIPVHSSFGGLLMQRPLLYTAISRAQKLCVLVGQRVEVTRTIGRNRPIKRFTGLAEMLGATQDSGEQA